MAAVSPNHFRRLVYQNISRNIVLAFSTQPIHFTVQCLELNLKRLSFLSIEKAPHSKGIYFSKAGNKEIKAASFSSSYTLHYDNSLDLMVNFF